ncbi:cerebellin-1-like [Engraulis encrasicolus]|uniref:cerebellin-1-like n=1 Tax=Engraulis encrasicolus TaxID=184585 RepID=UPI002FD05563
MRAMARGRRTSTMNTNRALLALLCLCLAETDGESSGTLQEGPGAAASTQPDIHAVLREMTSLITEQRVELKCTKTQLEAVESRLKASEKMVEQLQHESKAQTVNLNAALSQVEDLKKEKDTRKVSFSALLWESGSETQGPFSEATTLVFKRVITNVGNAYNSNTGIFTAPVRGVYQFLMFAHGHGHASHPVVIALFKNGEHIVTAWSHQRTYSVNPSNGASLQLEVGDVVYVKVWANARVFDNVNRHTTFSGHLLFPM